MEDLRAAFSNGEIDMIIAPPLLINKYLKPEELGDGFVGVLANNQQEALLLLARTDKNINTIKDIRGKRLVMNNNDELAEVFIDMLVLKDEHKSYKKMDLSLQFQKKSDRIVFDMYFDKADIGVVFASAYDLMTEMNPDIKSKVKILKEYPVKAKNFSFFRHNYPYIKEFTKVGLDFPNMARGKQILEVFKTPAIDYCTVEDLVVFNKFYNEYLQLKKTYDK
jgi:phosphonate transport system substrate-binding protein